VASSTSLSRAWDSGLGLTPLKSQARSTDPVALRSPKRSQSRLGSTSGLGFGLSRQERPEHP
ncbi:MAG: hypothetical protein QF750_06190, partial [Prochlorococcaceae cyanobacterium ETNP14_MAG_5]|nr:hypothetical protein [Prochlorococcaceae cyanobacterium ETNP14_MAG_5]